MVISLGPGAVIWIVSQCRSSVGFLSCHMDCERGGHLFGSLPCYIDCDCGGHLFVS